MLPLFMYREITGDYVNCSSGFVKYQDKFLYSKQELQV